MNKLLVIFCSTALLVFTSCKNNKNIPPIADADTTLYYLDSSQINQFLDKHTTLQHHQEMKSFYADRNNAFAWINSAGVNEYAGSFINLLNHEEVKFRTDTAFHQSKLNALYQSISEESDNINSKDNAAIELELLLTMNYFEYAKRNWSTVSNETMRQADWFIERKRIDYKQFLDTSLKNNNHSAAANQPINRQYELLKTYLQKYYAIEQKGGWSSISDESNKLKKGDSALAISKIKKQLFLMEDLTVNDSSRLFNQPLEDALKKFQNRFGIKEDGMLTNATLQALQVSLTTSIQKILINMERSRWVPAQMKGDYLAVNIPEFQLHVYTNDKLDWSCNVVVGKSKRVNNTVIFNDSLESVVFSPYWNIPKGILAKEILPGIQKNINYLANHNLEVIDGEKPIAATSINWSQYTASSFPYIIRQIPGKKNSLGLVKFLFPNQYDIYLHDTPEKSLFEEESRAFSHGCVRVVEPFKLAKFLLRNEPTWTDTKITTAMNGGVQNIVMLKTKVPVFIVYFTAFVDRAGKLNFRDDVYHHDDKMKKLLFLN